MCTLDIIQFACIQFFWKKDAFFSRRFQLWLWTSCVEWLIYARSDCGLKSDLFIRAPELSAGRPDRAADIINTFSSFSTHSCFSFLCHYVKRKLWKAQKSCLFLSILDTQVFMCNSNKNIIHSDILLHQKGHFSIDSNVNLNINVYLFTHKCENRWKILMTHDLALICKPSSNQMLCWIRMSRPLCYKHHLLLTGSIVTRDYRDYSWRILATRRKHAQSNFLFH